MKKSFLDFLGIALRAGKMITGTELTLQGIRNKSVKLVIIASDCSDRTKKDMANKADSYDVTLIDHFTSQELKDAIGKERKVIGITDLGIARRLIEIMEN